MPDYQLAEPAVLTFIVLPVLLAWLFTWGAAYAFSRPVGGRRVPALRMARLAGLASVAWLVVTWRVAAAGVLRQWDATPPPLMPLVGATFAIALFVAFGPVGRRMAATIPLWILVAVQAFRLPLELAMHAMATRGIMPPQMTYTGLNFDIVTGATAIVVALLSRRGIGGRPLVLVWNVVGSVLLATIVMVSVLSTPLVRAFGDDRLNVFVTYTPFVWLPTVMVLAALIGHLIIFRALRT